MPNGFRIARPPVLHTDNGGTYKNQRQIDLDDALSALKLKRIENQCLAELCRVKDKRIMEQDATICDLQKRVATLSKIRGM